MTPDDWKLVDPSHPKLEENERDKHKLKAYFDIILVRLKKPITFTSTVRPVCLPGPSRTLDYGVYVCSINLENEKYVFLEYKWN